MSKFASRALIAALSAWLGLALMTTGAHAQTREQSAERARAAQAEDALKQATKLATQYELPCELVEARTLGEAEAIQDGVKKTVETFEIACKDQRGYFLFAHKDAPLGEPMSCLEAAAIQKTDANAPLCKLKSNRAAHYWLGPIAKTRLADCAIAGARFIGPDSSGQKEVFEVQCKTTPGGIFLVPKHKAEDQKLGFFNCLKTEGTPLKCENTPHDVAVRHLAAAVKTNSPDCTLSDARFVGATKEAEYYEIGCAGSAGYVLVTNLEGQFTAAVGCDKAESIGGCKFTDASAMAEAKKAKGDAEKAKLQPRYTAALTKAGVTCTVEDFRRIGRDKETARDLAEFKCTESPTGLVAFIPDGDQAAETFDCFVAQVSKLECQYVTAAQLIAHLQGLSANHKSIKPDCVISKARYAFENAGQVVMEIACENKRGYIVVLNKARMALNPAVPCHIAATNPNVPEKCTLKDNGSNTGA